MSHLEPRGIVLHDQETDTLVTLPPETEFRTWIAGRLRTVRLRVARGTLVEQEPER